MIVIEGPDGSGKTTLSSLLLAEDIVSKVLPSPRIPAKGDAERMKAETDRYLRLYGDNNNIAVDRFMFSEMVYGPILRGTSVFNRAEYLQILLRLLTSGSIVIFCLPDKLNYKKDENPQVIEDEGKIMAAYKALFEDSAFTIHRTYLYKWDEPDAYRNLKQFIKDERTVISEHY